MKFIVVLSFAAAALARTYDKCECKVDGTHNGPLTQNTCSNFGNTQWDGYSCVANNGDGKMSQNAFGASCRDMWIKNFGGNQGKTGVRCWG
ncbi:hypothetical protein E4U54_006884 [Claviceps lovelessii]|nr:hypothetical protein E4U54_006884 [Claviceps lovelessii]